MNQVETDLTKDKDSKSNHELQKNRRKILLQARWFQSGWVENESENKFHTTREIAEKIGIKNTHIEETSILLYNFDKAIKTSNGMVIYPYKMLQEGKIKGNYRKLNDVLEKYVGSGLINEYKGNKAMRLCTRLLVKLEFREYLLRKQLRFKKQKNFGDVIINDKTSKPPKSLIRDHKFLYDYSNLLFRHQVLLPRKSVMAYMKGDNLGDGVQIYIQKNVNTALPYQPYLLPDIYYEQEQQQYQTTNTNEQYPITLWEIATYECKRFIYDLLHRHSQDGEWLDITNEWILDRVYCKGTTCLGGRLYCSGQSLPENSFDAHLRSQLVIDGEGVVELDFKCLHPTMSLNLQGISVGVNEDLYDFADREIAKKAILIGMNADNEKKAMYALMSICKISKDKAEKVFAEMLVRHPRIPFFKDMGVRLQYLDSKIMMDILETLRRQNILGLPIHDSCITGKSYESILFNTMNDSYYRHLKYYPKIEKK